MSFFVIQDNLISILNKYLEWHNFPFRLDETGICHGLSNVCAKYIIEGKEKKIRSLLKRIVNLDTISIVDDEINKFVTQVVYCSFPQFLDKKYCQYKATKLILSENKLMEPVFKLAMAADHNTWSDIFRQINLEQNEAMLLSGVDHTVTVFRNDDHYVIYNPNYLFGFAKFKNEKEVLSALHNIFEYKRGQLGMTMQVVRSPNSSARPMPSSVEIYQKYLRGKPLDWVVRRTEDKFDIFFEAVELDDACGVQQLIELGAEDPDCEVINIAVVNNSAEVLKVLLNHFKPTDDRKLKGLLLSVLKHGRLEAFEVLLAYAPINNIFTNVFIQSKHINEVINYTAMGGNPDLLKKIMAIYEDKKINISMLTPSIELAIESGSVACVQLLVNAGDLSEEEKFSLLLKAIKKNHPQIVSFLLAKMQNLEPLKTIQLSVRVANRTELSILEEIRNKGAIFSPFIFDIIEKKKHQRVSMITNIGIMLIDFIDFIKECLGKPGLTAGPTHEKSLANT